MVADSGELELQKTMRALCFAASLALLFCTRVVRHVLARVLLLVIVGIMSGTASAFSSSAVAAAHVAAADGSSAVAG